MSICRLKLPVLALTSLLSAGNPFTNYFCLAVEYYYCGIVKRWNGFRACVCDSGIRQCRVLVSAPQILHLCSLSLAFVAWKMASVKMKRHDDCKAPSESTQKPPCAC